MSEINYDSDKILIAFDNFIGSSGTVINHADANQILTNYQIPKAHHMTVKNGLATSGSFSVRCCLCKISSLNGFLLFIAL